MTNQEIRIIVHMEVLSDKIEDAKTILGALIAPTQKEEGCLQYEIFSEKEAPHKFTFIEHWKDRASLDAHVQSAHLQEGLKKLKSLKAGTSEIRKLTPVL